MIRPVKLLVGCIAAVAIGYLLAQPLPGSGGGQYRESPDKKWIAHASTLSEMRIFRTERPYYEFTIQTPPPSPRTIRKIRVDAHTEPLIDWREEGEIRWATNSSEVTYMHAGSNMTFEITLKMPQ